MQAPPLMKKPYVIIHTPTSLDGRNQQVLNIQGYLNGRVSTDDNFSHYRPGYKQPAHPATPDALVRVRQRTQQTQNMPTQP